MRKTCLPPFLVLLAGCWSIAGLAEDLFPPAESPLLVQRFGWRKERSLPASRTMPEFRADLGIDQSDLGALMAAQGLDPSGRKRSRERRTPLEVSSAALAGPVNEAPEGEWYRYAATLWNPGPLPVRSVVWDYVFREPESRRVIARVRFRSDETIKPGKKKSLEGFTTQPPGTVASVAALRDSGRQAQSIEIERIVFADKSVWQRR